MAKKILNLYFQGELAGKLEYENGKFFFEYDEGYQGKDISNNITKDKSHHTYDEVKAFFENLLPEQNIRKHIAKQYGISESNVFMILYHIGGDCAGCIELYPEDYIYNKQDEFSLKSFLTKYSCLDGNELVDIVKNLIDGYKGIPLDRMSLAGAQKKLTLIKLRHKVYGIRFFMPMDNFPSNCLIKVTNGRDDGLIYNEHFCMSLSSKMGFNTAKTTIHKLTEGLEFLSVRRFDRNIRQLGLMVSCSRKHMQDFCQVFNKESNVKYQKEGGPAIKDIFFELEGLDRKRFIQIIIFNYLIGNNDAHAKNFSILESGSFGQDVIYNLAPFYDLVSTNAYDYYEDKMAMKIGGEYEHNKIRYKHFYKMAKELKLTQRFIDKEILKISSDIVNVAEQLKKELIDIGFESDIYDKIIYLIQKNSMTLINSKQYASW
ncbi:MAG TPA: hypothetical protein DCL21_05770 [Alphaproteobacteria bacterium]|nr:hypothetical protein [Alphaproteobacteria bacterium]